MSLRVLSDIDRQSKLVEGQSRLLAVLEGVCKQFAGSNQNALENINEMLKIKLNRKIIEENQT